MSKARMIEVLDDLQALGFDDKAFAAAHHFRDRRNETIHAMRSYCALPGEFRDGHENERTLQRLEMVLKAYRAGGFKPGHAALFMALVDAAYQDLPPIGEEKAAQQ